MRTPVEQELLEAAKMAHNWFYREGDGPSALEVQVALGKAIEFAEKPGCPNCGSHDYVPQHILYTGIETTYQSCNDCDYQWGHE